ncbi:MAG: hypothetical protein E7446_07835 [Ruminococcaceae bacterium]|nr:hypothetical protein [Oscillospiraceae bacterium]
MKNKTMRLASVLLIAVLMTTSVISGTFAKYTSAVNGTDTARVAKWVVTLGDKSGTSAEQTFTFDLFNTVNDTLGGLEEHIAPADGTIIAPGTTGYFDIVLTNASEVSATYEIDYTVTNTANIPVQFKVTGGDWSFSLADVAATALASGTTTIKVEWKWAFDGNDVTDTNLGVTGTDTITVAAKITATQVD